MRSFIALLRRETWEHTTLKGLPMGLLAFVLLANIALSYGLFHYNTSVEISINGNDGDISELIDRFTQMPAAKQSEIVNGTLLTLGMIINSIILIMMFFYLIDSLYGERKDHSILFWKSLPVSDARTVLSKLAIALVIIPMVIFATTMLAQLITLSVHWFSLRETPAVAAMIWQRANLVSLWSLIGFLLIQQSIWYLPVMGWLLFCSAWSKKAPILTAVLIPALLVFIDSSFLLRTGVSEAILERLPIGIVSMQMDSSQLTYNSGVGDTSMAFSFDKGMPKPGLDNVIAFASNSKVWAGVIVGFLFTALAIWLRRWRDDSL